MPATLADVTLPYADETTWPYMPGCAPVPDWLTFHRDAMPSDVRVYAILAVQGPSSTMSHKEIAERANLSHRTIGAVIRRLADLGAIRVTPQYVGSGRSFNHYDLAWLTPFVFPFAADLGERPPPRRSRSAGGPATQRRRLERVVEADGGWFCHYCDEPVTDGREGLEGVRLHLDHVLPWSRGGSDHWTNRALSCPPCNLDKSAQTPEEWLGESCCERHLDLTPTRRLEGSN